MLKHKRIDKEEHILFFCIISVFTLFSISVALRLSSCLFLFVYSPYMLVYVRM